MPDENDTLPPKPNPPIKSHLKLAPRPDKKPGKRKKVEYTPEQKELVILWSHLKTCKSFSEAVEQAIISYGRNASKVLYLLENVGIENIGDEMRSQINLVPVTFHDLIERVENVVAYTESFEEVVRRMKFESDYARGTARTLKKLEKYFTEEVRQHRSQAT
jgi:hypothetical protein